MKFNEKYKNRNDIFYNTLLDYGRLEKIYEIISEVKEIKGSICEIGVYKGGSAKLFCEENKDSKIFLIDTFDGMPLTSELDNIHKKGDFNDTSLEYVYDLLKDSLYHTTIIKGIFPNIDLSELNNHNYKIVHIDVDIYQSYKDCLEFFYDKVVLNGYLILDDYYADTCLGAKIATDEFITKNKILLTPGFGTQALIKKIN
jgi:hypothetical protein